MWNNNKQLTILFKKIANNLRAVLDRKQLIIVVN